MAEDKKRDDIAVEMGERRGTGYESPVNSPRAAPPGPNGRCSKQPHIACDQLLWLFDSDDRDEQICAFRDWLQPELLSARSPGIFHPLKDAVRQTNDPDVVDSVRNSDPDMQNLRNHYLPRLQL